MSELKDKRVRFTAGLARLITYINYEGRLCAIAPDGLKHMPGSLHFKGLAKDLAIYKGETYLIRTEDYRFAGEFWKSLDHDFRWGGDFLKPDGNHFSIAYQGKS
jgi:hypothetical protein